jgi:hypothetical protein
MCRWIGIRRQRLDRGHAAGQILDPAKQAVDRQQPKVLARFGED